MNKLTSTLLLSTLTLASASSYGFGWPSKYKTNLEKTKLEVGSALCRSNTWPDLTEMKNYVYGQNFKPRDYSNRTFSSSGVTLRDESSDLVSRFRKLINPKVRINNKDCESISCLNRDIFDEEKGVLYLYMLSKYKLNFSHLSHSKNISTLNNWNDGDLELFKKVLVSIPEDVFKGKSTYKVFKNFYTGNSSLLPKKIYGKLNPSHKALTLFSDWSRLGHRNQKEYVIFHELSHVIDEKNGSLSNSKEWISFSKWRLKRGKLEWKAGKKSNLISNYAATAPSEDFAESLYAYRYIPEKLKLVSMEKYNFIKNNVFNGVSFDSENTCSKSETSSSVDQFSRRLHTSKCYYRGDRFEPRDTDSFEACLFFYDKDQ